MKYPLSAHVIPSSMWGTWSTSQFLTCDILDVNLGKCAQTRKVLFENKTMLHIFAQNKWPLTCIIQNPLIYFRNLGLIWFDAMI